MSPEERAAGLSTVDLGGWPDPPPAEDPDVIGWQEVRGAMAILAVTAAAFIVVGVAVLWSA